MRYTLDFGGTYLNYFHKIAKILIENGVNGLINKLYKKTIKREWSKEYRDFLYQAEIGEWDKAISIGNKIFERYKNNENFHQKMAMCFGTINKNNQALKHIQKALELKMDCNIEDFVSGIERAISPELNISSKYYYISGHQSNWGIFEHDLISNESGRKFITKIVSAKDCYYREKNFYLNICSRFPVLKSVSPSLIYYSEMDSRGLYILTLEKVTGRRPDIDDLKEIIKLNETINSIAYGDVKEFLPPKTPFISEIDNNLRFWGGFNHIFANIHKEETNKEVFRWLFVRIRKLSYSEKLLLLAEKLRFLILGQKIYEYLDPQKHYCLQHYDFHKEHIYLDDENLRACVIDWEKYYVGPKGYDLIQFFFRFNPQFRIVEEQFLSSNDRMDTIQKIFFVYPLLISYFVLLKNDSLEEHLSARIEPAIKYLEELIVLLNRK